MAIALMIDPADGVATLLGDVDAGEAVVVGDTNITATAAIPSGHKIALRAIHTGEPVLKFGFPIGTASRPIAIGNHVHSDNLATGLSGELDYSYAPAPDIAQPAIAGTFMGYRRPDGRVGTRNEIWVLPTVGCVSRTAERVAARGAAEHGSAIDGVFAFTHPYGCSQLGADLSATRRILAGLADNPNAGGVVIIGLGCESNQIDALLAEIPEAKRSMVRTLVAQRAGDEVEEGVALVAELAAMIAAPREQFGMEALVLGVKCGGSDGFSGLTANPLVGKMSDRVTAAGGKVVLTEIPEIFGAEQMLMNRASDTQIFDGIVGIVNGFKRYFADHGEPVSENPSPGNIAGGITTLEEKSLGAVQKAGHAPVVDVINYADSVRKAGLTLLEGPGNDAVSSTALAAAGATAILFTTGRGTPLGFPVPTIKIASNSELAARKPGWIDFDAGQVLTDGFAGAENALADLLGAVASGQQTAAERNGEREIAIWKRGVTL
jgi:altronate hydrolase